MASEEQIVKNSKFVKAINNMEDDIDYEQNYFDSEDEYLQQEIDNVQGQSDEVAKLIAFIRQSAGEPQAQAVINKAKNKKMC